jgi:peroxiredoxin
MHGQGDSTMLILSKRNILSVVVGAAILGLAAPSTLAQDSATPGKRGQEHKEKDKNEHKDKGEHKDAKAAKVGEPAPAFELKDTDGKTVKLSDYKGKVVVLDWFNPECPVCAGHYDAGTVQNLVKKYSDKGVVFLAINSGGKGKQGNGVERNAEAKKNWKITFPVLMDESGTVGHTYGAKTTPHCYVIDKAGTLVYAGAIDDGAEKHGGKIGKVNYVAKALDAVLAGETVSPAETKPYGCGVKYGSSKN